MKSKEVKEFRLGELFCGPGGLAYAAVNSQIEDSEYKIIHKWSNDYDLDTCKTYTRNICPNDPESVICGDVRKLDIEPLGDIDALEYRGRQAFNTINMEMGRKAIYSLEMVGSTNKAEGKEATVILTTSRKDNMNTKRRDWVIKKCDLLQFINEQKPDDAHKYETIFADLDDKILVESITGFICKNAIKYTKQEKDGELLLKIQLLR